MKASDWIGSGVAIAAIILSTACTEKQQPVTAAEASMGIRADAKTIKRLEKFLGIPVCPGAKLADISTERSDGQIPNQRVEASVTLIVDDFAEVPAFYEEKLGRTFKVEEDEEWRSYTLEFEQDGWLYEISVNNSTYMNKPSYSIWVYAAD